MKSEIYHKAKLPLTFTCQELLEVQRGWRKFNKLLLVHAVFSIPIKYTNRSTKNLGVPITLFLTSHFHFFIKACWFNHQIES